MEGALRLLVFQSTSSVWRTTAHDNRDHVLRNISIHVLRVEDDSSLPLMVPSTPNFNPRPPCGGRLSVGTSKAVNITFQSTSSVWRTTAGSTRRAHARLISIHVLRVEDDICHKSPFAFQSISIHVLRVEDDAQKSPLLLHTSISIHVLRVEDDRGYGKTGARCAYFNPRPPCGGRPHFARRCCAAE